MTGDAPSGDVIADYWNRNVANWKVAAHLEPGTEAFFREVERYRFDKLSYLLNYVDYSAHAGARVLDVGCGLGTDLSRFAAGGAEAVGIDIAPRAVELARANFAWRGLDGEFRVMDGRAMTFEDASFDVVYCHTMLHFSPEPERVIAEVRRVLKPGGLAIFATINRRSWLYALHKLAKVKIDYPDSPVFAPKTRGEFEALLSGFQDLQVIVERFPVRTEVHKGLKAQLYNLFFVDLYNALPKALTGNTGYHLLGLATRRE